MRTVKKNVYYCDFCTKKALRKDCIQKHEPYCTLNPNRICRLCEDKNSKKVKELITEINKSDFVEQEYLNSEEFINEIKRTITNCPNCILSILRQIGAKNWARI